MIICKMQVLQIVTNLEYFNAFIVYACLILPNIEFFCTVISGRVDNVYGDRNLVCTLLPASHVVEEQAAATA